ncbi:MAG: flavodoxin family protein [Candidatus Thorarchaeota archaeon]
MKNVLVVFDSKFGNTEKLAREIASGIDETGLASAQVINIDDVENLDISSFDGVLFGAPIHAFRATSGIKRAVKTAAKLGLDDKLVGAFDTYMAPGHVGKCAGQIEGELKKKAKGARLYSRYLSSRVDGYEGPLNEAEPAKARAFGKEFATELSQ